MTALTELNTGKAASEISAEEKEKHTTKYSYDIDGNLLSVTYPEADWNVVSLKYTYDQNKWLQKVTAVLKDGKEATLRTYAYDAYGDVSEIRDYRAFTKTGELARSPESTVCSYTYDALRRPLSMSYADSTDPDTVKEAYTYAYDKNSRLVRETLQNFYPEAEGDCQNEVRSYRYDARGNLVQTDVQNLLNASESYVMSYTYDAVGNRLTQEKSMADGKETTRYSYNSLNQLTSSETKKADGTVSSAKAYTYDANGNQTREADSVSGKETLNTYDPAGRLSACTIKENGQVTLEQTNRYNGSGARTLKEENGKKTNYFYSQGGVLYTEDGNGSETSLNLQGVSGNIISTVRHEKEGDGYYHYHKDPAGSITNLRDADGTSVVSYQYTDFGETTVYGDTDFYNEFCYNEAVYDKSTGLYYLSARYYDPEDGRFLTRDSYRGNVSNPSTLHLYAYCANNPVNYEDPSGHIAISRIVGGIIGGAAGAWVGTKIAKKTKAKGWKKVAIIAGCTIGGAVIGAIAGPKVAKVAKKAASYVKRKLPSKRQIYQTAKKTVSKVKSGVKKVASKAKKAVSKGKQKVSNLKSKIQKARNKIGKPKNSIDATENGAKQVFKNKGYSPRSGERTINGYVKNNANPEISLHTNSAGFSNNSAGQGGVFKRLGAESHGGISPHVHQPQRNIAPNGDIFGTVGRKTANGGVTYPNRVDVRQLYEYLVNGKYH